MVRLARVVREQALGFTALCVALSGTAYAATQLAPNSVASKQVRNGSLTSSDVKDGTLRRRDFKASQLPAAGRTGTPGASGSAKAYGRVEGNGTVRAPTLGFGASSATRTAVGKYCVGPLTGANRLNSVLVLTIDDADGQSLAGDTVVVEANGGGCPDSKWQVLTFDKTGALSDAGFVAAVL